ncbi:mechanosensitive ion channel family protein [Candidatus Woesearchaeota archaeon]|nr:mechanosensitive ion channel family protein [Candidatus Woesearchaeota archaeon]
MEAIVGFLENLGLIISSHKYIQALINIVIFLILAKAIAYIAKTYFQNLVRKTANTLDDELLDKTEYPFIILIVLLGSIISLRIIDANTKLLLITESAIILISSYIISTMFRIFLKFWEESWSIKRNVQIDNIMFSLLDKIISATIISIGVLIILDKWSIAIGPIMASLGVVGIIVGFGLKDSFGNIFSGFFLVIDRAYNYNDTIKLDTGEFGNVIEVGFRSTRVRTFDNEVLIIPNSKIASSVIKNYARPNNKTRAKINFSVEYGSDPKKVEEVVLKTIKQIPNILDEPEPFVYFEEMGDYALKFNLYYWVDSFRDKFLSKHHANILIYQALNNSGIGIPFPTRTIYTKPVKTKRTRKTIRTKITKKTRKAR